MRPAGSGRIHAGGTMPVYLNRENAENLIPLSRDLSTQTWGTTELTIEKLSSAILEDDLTVVLLDGWLGIDWTTLVDGLTSNVPGLQAIASHEFFQAQDDIELYHKPYSQTEESFGYVNSDGTLMDIVETGKLKEVVDRVSRRQPDEKFLIYGPGAGLVSGAGDLVVYLDKCQEQMLWKMWKNELVPLGGSTPKKNYDWKEYYYCDFYLLYEQKKAVTRRMDYYIEANDDGVYRMMTREVFDATFAHLASAPFKQVRAYSPGPWGAYRYKDFWDIPGLECNAWNRLAGPDMSVLARAGEVVFEIPTNSILVHASDFVGPYIAETFPDLFPFEIWLDDGYFPEPQPAERTSMPIHNHPGTDYVKRHFGEPMGRYETYCIVEAYEGANTWMGFNRDVHEEDWEEACRQSERTGKPIENWKEYIKNWPTKVGDLFWIPPGTTHAHGGNQMVLEMDTCTSLPGTEYSFFTYDFVRPTWDDTTKTMTAKPCNMHIEHGFDNERWRREDEVRDELIAGSRVIKWTKDFWMERYTQHPLSPFQVERLFFDEFAEHDTEGTFLHIVTLTQGVRVRVESLRNPELATEIDHLQAAIIPACFGAYRVKNLDKGRCTGVVMRWTKG